jgi:hypothetical protein
MTPCLRRTQWPSFKSIAGMISMATENEVVGGRAEEK